MTLEKLLLAAAACALVLIALLAPTALASTDPGSGGCPNGYLGTSVNGTFVGAPVRAGTTDTTSAPRWNELVGTGCYRRSATTATVRFSWSAVGPVYSGTFIYQLVDCTVGGTSRALTRYLGYPNGSPGTAASVAATFRVDPTHRYRLRISGDGAFRRAVDGLGGAIGYYSLHPPVGLPAWRSETPCG